MTDWMMGGPAENDADEARTERRWGPPPPEPERPDWSDVRDEPDLLLGPEEMDEFCGPEPEDDSG